jgi:hypothetical protein
MAIYLVVFIASAAMRLARPLEEFMYGESWVLEGARRIVRGDGLYGPADRIPLMHIAYGPVHYAAVAALLRVFGDAGYTAGRALSLAATLAASLGLAWAVKTISGRWLAGALAAGLFLTQNVTVLLWAPLLRVDALGLAFSVVGLALATSGRTYAAVPLFLLALFTKATFVAAPLAVWLALWPCRERMLRFAGLLVGGVLLGVGVAQWLSGGWFLWHQVIGNSNQADFETFAVLMGSFLQFNGLPVLAAVGTFVLPMARGEGIWRWYLVGTLLMLFTIAKIGASSNYWLELTAATSVGIALGAWRLAALPMAEVVAPLLVAGSLLIAVPAYQANAMEASQALNDVLRPPAEPYLSLIGDAGVVTLRVRADFVAELAAEPGELLTDNSGLAVAAGKRVAHEFQIFQLLSVEGHWSEQPILDAIARQEFSLVVLMHPLDGPLDGTRITGTVRDALLGAYVPAGSKAGFWLYRPRPG